jgi:hypothetical protein
MKRDNLILQAGRWMRLLTCFLVILAVAIQCDGRILGHDLHGDAIAVAVLFVALSLFVQRPFYRFTALTALAIIQDAVEQTISTMDVVSGMSPNPTIGDTMPPNTKPMAPTMAAAAPV